ncbi:hypothetical protein A8U91_01686 [Halomonas elongata]|uniref:Uncharacterized protein n=1 Tax=Halomonas elongata TaxID=2746 RepID=A0A1B8P516_HALEL|nr:hypothetical protein A8U91_01686 [Halomonas elongata]
MARRIAVEKMIGTARQRLDLHAVEAPQPLIDGLLTRLIGHAVKLGTIAGRQYRGLAHFGQATQFVQRLLELRRSESDPFANLERRGAVIDSQGKKRHASVS